MKPFRLDVMPTVIALSRALELPAAQPVNPAFNILVGVGGDDAFPVPGRLHCRLRLPDRRAAAHRPQHCLASAANVLHSQGIPLWLVAPKPTAAERARPTRWGSRTMHRAGPGGGHRSTGWVAEHERCAVLVDDAELVHGSDVDSALIELARERPAGIVRADRGGRHR